MPSLVGEGGEQVALRDQAHVDQDLAELVAALVLEFEGAVEVFGVDLAALDENLAEAHVRLFDLTPQTSEMRAVIEDLCEFWKRNLLEGKFPEFIQNCENIRSFLDIFEAE